jgi:histidine phosphotransfer protein HptB
MSDICVIDPKALENLRALDPGGSDEFLREITGIFLEDTPLRIEELAKSLIDGDVGRFIRAAHSIKGSAANLGAVGLRAVAEKLERQSRSHGLADVGAMVADVRAEFDRAQAALAIVLSK